MVKKKASKTPSKSSRKTPSKTNGKGNGKAAVSMKGKYKRCATATCSKRVLVSSGNIYCEHCLKERHFANFPQDNMQRMTEVQRLGIQQMETAMTNADQAARILELEIDQIRRDAEKQVMAKVQQKNVVEANKKARRAEYEALITSIAQEHGIEPKNFVFDLKAATVRDITVIDTASEAEQAKARAQTHVVTTAKG